VVLVEDGGGVRQVQVLLARHAPRDGGQPVEVVPAKFKRSLIEIYCC
jgi:hypothetical protein